MAYSLVGTIGIASQAALSTAITPAWGTSENRDVGNLLILFLAQTGTGVSAAPATPAGWTLAVNVEATNTGAAMYFKIATGADTAPTIAAITNVTLAAQLAEFSGNATTSPKDKQGGNTGAASPVTATFSSADTSAGELLVICSADARSAARTPTDTLTSNNATITQAGNNNGVSSANHYSFGYSLATTSNASADTAVVTASVTTSLTGLCVNAATFKLAAAGIVADLSKTLDAATLSAAATNAVLADLSKTLDAVTLSSDAHNENPNPASLSVTLGALTLSSTAANLVAADLSKTLGIATLSSTGTVTAPSRIADLSKTLGSATLVSTHF